MPHWWDSYRIILSGVILRYWWMDYWLQLNFLMIEAPSSWLLQWLESEHRLIFGVEGWGLIALVQRIIHFSDGIANDFQKFWSRYYISLTFIFQWLEHIQILCFFRKLSRWRHVYHNIWGVVQCWILPRKCNPGLPCPCCEGETSSNHTQKWGPWTRG